MIEIRANYKLKISIVASLSANMNFAFLSSGIPSLQPSGVNPESVQCTDLITVQPVVGFRVESPSGAEV